MLVEVNSARLDTLIGHTCLLLVTVHTVHTDFHATRSRLDLRVGYESWVFINTNLLYFYC